MKKIAFFLEVLILLGVIPLYVFLEMDHPAKHLPENNFRSNYPNTAEQNTITNESTKNYQLKTIS